GWMVRPHVHTMMTLDEAWLGRLAYRAKLALTPDGRRLYLGPEGNPKKVGDRIRNPELAESLRTVPRGGAETFYTRTLAERIAADRRAHGGLITTGDLERYAPRDVEPLPVSYRGRTVASPPPPAGGIVVAQMLRILERFDLVSLGHNSAEYIRVVAEAMK